MLPRLKNKIQKKRREKGTPDPCLKAEYAIRIEITEITNTRTHIQPDLVNILKILKNKSKFVEKEHKRKATLHIKLNIHAYTHTHTNADF